MRFLNFPLWWSVAAVAILGLAIVAIRRSREELEQLADSHLLSKLVPNYGSNKFAQAITLELLALALLVVAVARPQWGFTTRETKRHGADLVFAVDVSKSMLANDLKPTRLEHARRAILDLLPRIAGNRVGLVSFAGSAFVEVPLTGDIATFKLFVNNLSPELVPVPGTNLQAAVTQSIKVLVGETEGNVSTKNKKLLILITDGEALSGELGTATALAKSKGITVHCVGVGTDNGSPIPIEGRLKKDNAGKVVFSKLDRQGLSELAAATGGVYVEASSGGSELEELYRAGIEPYKNAEGSGNSLVQVWNEYFQIPLLLALLLLIFSRLRFRRKVRLEPQIQTIAASLMLMLLLPQISLAQSAEWQGERGARELREGRPAQALEAFEAGRKLAPQDTRFLDGIGTSLYRLGRFAEAEKIFEEASKQESDPIRQAQALFDAGNSAAQGGDLDQAIARYQEALKIQPDDRETKENLELVKKLKDLQNSSSSSSSASSSEASSDSSSDSNSSSSSQSDSASGGQSSSESSGEQTSKSSEGGSSQSSGDEGSEGSSASSQGADSSGSGGAASSTEESSSSQEKSTSPEDSTESAATSSQRPMDQLQSLLDNIQEDNSGLIEYRKETAAENAQDRREKDW